MRKFAAPKPIDLRRRQSQHFLAGQPSVGVLNTVADPLTYDYHEFTTLALGRSFSPNDVTNSKLPAIEFQAQQLDPGAPFTSFTATYVTDEEQLNFALGIDQKASASYLKFNASSHFNFNLAGAFQSKSIIVVISAKTSFGRWGLDPAAKFSQAAEKMLGDGKKFEQVYGSRYVSMEWRGSSVSAVFRLDSVSSEFKSSFSSEFSASGGWGPLSASASSKFNFELKRAAKQSRVSVQFGATGGTGFGALGATVAGMLAGDDQTSKIGKALSDYVETFTQANAVATRFAVAPMSDFGWNPLSIDPWTDIQEQRLREIYTEYRRTTEDLSFSQAIVAGTTPFSKLLPTAVVAQINNEIPRLAQYQLDLASAHQACKASTPTSVSWALPASKIRSSIPYDMLGPPRIVFQIYGLTEEQCRVVLDAPENARDSIAQQFNPAVKKVAATVYTMGFFLLTKQFRFEDENGQLWNVTTETPDAQGGALIWCGMPGNNLEDWFIEWMLSWRGTHEGTFFLASKNDAGVVHNIPFMSASWQVNSDGSVAKIRTQMIF